MSKITLKFYRRISNKNLQDAMKKAGMNNETLASKPESNVTTISCIINFRQNPSNDMKARIAIALNVPIDDIFPERYDELYAKISPLPKTANVVVDTLRLDAPEVLMLESPEGREWIEEQAEKNLAKRRLLTMIENINLSPREIQVLKLRFGLEDGITKTLEEVCKSIGVTRERIRQIEAKSLEKIRVHLRDYDNPSVENDAVTLLSLMSEAGHRM